VYGTTLGKIIAIVGPTAAGKSGLAMALAGSFDGEIVCADSRTLLRGMDIGTAKPTQADRRRIPHHLLDIRNPDQPMSATEFKTQALEAIWDIAGRGKLPLLVGGSGLYVYSVLYDFQFPAGPRTGEREKLERRSLDELILELREVDPERAEEIDLKNKRRVIRALETVGQPRRRRRQLPANYLLLGLRPVESELHTRIVHRTGSMFETGLVAEVLRLVEVYGADLEVLRSPGYAEVIQLLRGEISAEEAQDLVALHTRQLAKRQVTWFKRNDEIRWLENAQSAEAVVQAFLQGKAV
jgi:tRNA dimethylallyltransferase